MYTFFVNLIRAALNGTAPEAPPDGIDWKQLYNLADFHSVAGTVYYGIMRLPAEWQPEADVLAMFRNAMQITLGREAAQHFELKNIMKHMDENHVRYLPLKGWKMKHLYPRPDMRSMCDIDILVMPEDMKMIPEIMKCCNFGFEERGVNHDSYMNSGSVSVEVHWSLFDEESPYYQYFSDFMGRTDAAAPDGYERKLSNEDFYLHLIAHMAKHFKGGGTGVRSIMDIYEYQCAYRDTLDAHYLDSELEKLGLDRFADAAWELAQDWFSGEAGADNQLRHPKMAQHILTAGTYGCMENKIASSMQQKNISKAEYLFGRFFPKRSFMQIQYPCLNKAPFLLPVFWVVRGMRSVFFRRRKLKHEINKVRDVEGKHMERLKEIWEDSGLG